MTATMAPPRPPATGVAPRTGASRSWYADVAGTAFALSMLVVVALWVAHGGVQALGGGWVGATTSLGRLSGLVASDLLLIQVLLMARVPWIEGGFGADRLARWHRWTGFSSVNLMVVHVVLITIGYAGTVRGAALVSQAWSLVTTYPGMLLATAATALLLLVAATSMRAARRRLRYESWHLLHLYAYLGVGLALPHELWTGTEFISSAAAQLYWWGAYGLVTGCVLVFRVAVPLWRSQYHRVEVAAVVPESPGVVSVYLRGRRLDRLGARAGQFLRWRFLDGPGWSRANPYSLSAQPRPDLMRITVKDLGDGSRRLSRLRPGTRVLLEGPHGHLTGEAYRGGKVTLIAAGIGITPMRALLEELPYRPGEAVLLYRARSVADLALRAELDAIATARGVRVAYLTGPRAAAASWLPASASADRAGGSGSADRAGGSADRVSASADAAMLRRLIPDIAEHDLFVCGPDTWMDTVTTAARRCGVPAAQIHSERFAW
jgi:predicted ferric reductase